MPEVGYEAVGDPTYPDIGCNRLRCTTCGAPVRDLVGLAPAQGLSREQTIVLYAEAATGVGPASMALLRDDPNARLYLCACGGRFLCMRSRYLAAGPEDDYTGPAPSDWSCGGHDPLAIPGDIDGEAIPPGPDGVGSDADWDALAAGAIRGQRAEARPAYLAVPPRAWCRRMLWLLPSPEREALGEALGRMVLGPDPDDRSQALALYLDAPLACGAEAVETLSETVRGQPSGPSTTAVPAALTAKVTPAETASDVVQLVLAQRLARVSTQALPGTARAARQALTWPSKRRLVLIEALAARDLEGVLDTLEAFPSERMVARQLLLGAYRAERDAGVARLVARMQALAHPALVHLVDLARTNLPAASATKVAEAIDGIEPKP